MRKPHGESAQLLEQPGTGLVGGPRGLRRPGISSSPDVNSVSEVSLRAEIHQSY